MRRLLPLLVLLTSAPLADAQKAKGKYDPPVSIEPVAEVMREIQAKTAQLAAKIAELRKDKKHKDLAASGWRFSEQLPEVEIYLRAAENIVRYQEFYHKNSGQWTLDMLDAGIKRAEQL